MKHGRVFYWRGRWRDTATGRFLTTAEIDAFNGSVRGKVRSYEGIGEYILKHLPSRESLAINSTTLHCRVLEDYGSINLRVFYRRLVDMRTAGEVNFKRGAKVMDRTEILYWRKR